MSIAQSDMEGLKSLDGKMNWNGEMAMEWTVEFCQEPIMSS